MILVHMDPDEGPELFYDAEKLWVKPKGELIRVGQYIQNGGLRLHNPVEDALILYEQCIKDWFNHKCDWYHVDELRDILSLVVVDYIREG